MSKPPLTCTDSLAQKETFYPVRSLTYTLNNSIKEMATTKKFYCLNTVGLDYAENSIPQ